MGGVAEATSLAGPIAPARHWSTYLQRTLALLAGAVFLYAGAVKVLDPLRFASDITKYQMVPWAVAVGIAFYLPWLEILCGLALVLQRLFQASLLVSGALMIAFIGVSISAKARGIDVSCGCFGTASSNLSFTWHLVLDFVLLGILAMLWFWRARRTRS